MRSNSRLVMLTVLVLALVGIPSHAVAQEIDVQPPRPIVSMPGVTVDEQSVVANIDGPIAEVVVTQQYRNDSPRLVEGSFLFPLPEDAAIGDFQMTVNGQVVEGRLMDSDEARAIYEKTVREIRDPALLEYVGRGLYQTSVFPIPPGETRQVQLRYGVVLDVDNGLYRFTYPLRVPAASRAPDTTELLVNIVSDQGLRTIYSPSHEVEIDRKGNHDASVRYVSQERPEPGEFELFFGLSDDAVAVSLISSRPAGEDGYFVLLASPVVDTGGVEIADRDVIFVVDVSGSMEGPKLAQAKDAVSHVVGRLNPGDRFNLIAFSTGALLWSGHMVAATQDKVDDALAWVEGLDATGSTDINRALLEALAQLGDRPDGTSAPGYVLFMTDGLPTQGETDIGKILRNANANRPEDANTRLFTFGVGFDVNTDLLDRLSRDLGGRSRYVRPDQRIDEAVGDFYATIQTPVLTNVEIGFSADISASDIYPYPLPDLFAGEQLVLTGRYRRGGDTGVQLRGDVNGQPIVYEYSGLSLAEAGGEPFVARLWATRKIGALLDEIRDSGPNPELVDAIVDLSMRYGIVTPYTSYLVEEPMVRAVGDGRADQPVPQPRGQLLYDAKQSVLAAAEEEAAAPASGEAAVASSLARESLRSAAGAPQHQDIRFAGGRTLMSAGAVTSADGGEHTLWVDVSYSDENKVEVVPFASERYFELAADPEIAEVLALSSEILFALNDGSAIRVTVDSSDDGTQLLGDGLQSSGSGERTRGDEIISGLWEQVLSWLRRATHR